MSNEFQSCTSCFETSTAELTSETSKPETTKCTSPMICNNFISMNSEIMYNIALKSQDVCVNNEKLVTLAEQFAKEIITNYRNDEFRDSINKSIRHVQFYPTVCDNTTLDWLFMLNALNFSLWNPKDSKQWTVCGQTGYMALYSAIKRAIDVEGRPIWCPSYYSEITSKELGIIFRSDDNETTIPLIDERVAVLHEIGTVLLNRFQGTFMKCVELCRGDEIKLLYMLEDEFKSYQDIVHYEGQEVFIGSKAAALIADLKYFHKVSQTRDIASTMLIDYRSPQVLLHFGVLSYSRRLKAKFAGHDKPLEHGSKEEIEIRCCSHYAFFMLTHCALIIACRQQITQAKEIQILNIPMMIDNFLWYYRHFHDKYLYDNVPFHNIRSIYY